MGHKDLTLETGSYYLNRISKIQGKPTRRWGTMEPAEMLAHLRLLFESSLGELHTPGNGKVPFRWMKGIVLSGVMPFPKNRLKAPKMFVTHDVDCVADEHERLASAIERFLSLVEKEPEKIQVHGILGPLNMTQWARFHGMHLNHHLDQFTL